jgi:hypothetical protein
MEKMIKVCRMGSWFFIYAILASTKDNNHVITHSKQQSKTMNPSRLELKWNIGD